ncbi:MAG: hypothetical protein NDJ94_16300 [Vicinamibacteria bacterium]|nr:hypothetical protein [Vicinamibacteria bacterium]
MSGKKLPLAWILAGAGCLVVGGGAAVVTLGGIVWYSTTRGSSGSGAPDPGRRASSGKLTGTVRDERGKPINVPGAHVRIMVSGISERSGERVNYQPPVNASGAYSAPLVAGIYHPIQAFAELTFNGSSYRFELDPVQPNVSDRPSQPGIVQDFVWKLSGPHHRYRQNPNPKNHTHWYGGSVNVSLSGYRNDLRQPVQPPPVGTKYVFTFTPQGNRVDGAPAKVMTFERTWTSGGELDNGLLSDIPIAVYTMTGVEVGAGGQRPLIFETSYAKFEPQVKIDFPQSGIGSGPHVAILSFDRQ